MNKKQFQMPKKSQSQRQADKGSAILRIRSERGNGNHAYSEELLEFVKGFPGVSSASINYLTDMIKVDYDPIKITFDEINRRVRNYEKSTFSKS
jgi:hypothetical protein